MIPNTTLQWPGVIEFGAGKLKSLPNHLAGHRSIFILADIPVKAALEPVISDLKQRHCRVMLSTDVVPEPPFEALEKLLEPVHEFEPDAVVGVGGGSAMDMAKLVAVLFPGEQKPHEVVGIGNVHGRPVKLIAVATTSGTGSEVTPIAVLTDVTQKLKKGVVSKYLVPDVAIVDPELTRSLPAAVTAATGMDAMTHCIEAYTNRHAHPIIDVIALEGIRLMGGALETAVHDGQNMDARTAMALGSLYGGMCLGPVNTAAVHALAYPLGGEFKVAHGLSNSVLLPFVMAFNLPACITKYAKIAAALGVPQAGSDEAMARQAIHAVRRLSISCGIPSSLNEFSIPEPAIPAMAAAAMQVKRLLDNNPREVTLADAEAIFRNAYHGRLND
ncbi:MAG: iron-containing alcohol dehydrogenase [Acidobacteria bacterium]|nr:iron-containing alcohol dehydrogenase [Acidobacteriota bacterium]